MSHPDTIEVLLAGGAGRVGTELRAIAPAHWRISAPSRAELDLAREDEVAAVVAWRSWSLVINAAGYTAVDRAEDEIAAAWTANAMGAAMLAGASARAGAPLIQLSTDYVFDGAKGAPYVEDDPVRPLGVYGASKEGGEQAVRTAGGRHVILRTAWLVGPHGSNFVKTIFRLAEQQPRLRVVDDQHGCPTTTGDLAAAIVTIGDRLVADAAAPSGTYHVVNAGEATWRELAVAAFEARAAFGRAAPQVEAIAAADYPARARRPVDSRLSSAKLARDYGVTPRHWRDALADVVAALVAQAGEAGVE